MKFIILFACLLAFAAAGDDRDAKVIVSDSEVNADSFKYVYEFDNSIKAQQEGHLEGDENWKVNGEYSYTGPDGREVKVTYIADDTGYHPTVHL